MTRGGVQGRSDVDFRGSAPKRDVPSQVRVTQIHAEPREDAKTNRHARIKGGLMADHIGADCTAEVCREQNRSEDRRLGKNVENHASEQGDANPEHLICVDSDPCARLDDLRQLEDLGDGVEKHKQNDQTADDAAGPQTTLRHRNCFIGSRHEFPPVDFPLKRTAFEHSS